MGEIWTSLKIFISSLLLLGFLQIPYEGRTLERYLLLKLHQSDLGQQLNDVALGGEKLFRQSKLWLSNQWNRAWPSQPQSIEEASEPKSARH